MGIMLPNTFVVDCSIVAGAFLADEQSPLAAAIRERCADLTLIAPRVLRLEFLNVALIAHRRGRLDDRHFATLLAQGAQFPVHYDDGDTSLVEFGRSALRLGLTSYDYAYLDCARRRGLALATLDRSLLRVCAQAGVETLTDAAGVAEARPHYRAERAPRRASPAARAPRVGR
jgi:predicted nucleic acid-binding protein